MLTVQRMCGYLNTEGAGMKRSLCLLLSVVSSCYGFVDEEGDQEVVFRSQEMTQVMTFHELIHELSLKSPQPAKVLLKPEVIATLASGVLATTAATPKPQHLRGNSFSWTNALCVLAFGGGITGLLVYAFIGEEMGTIVAFKGTLKKLSSQIAAWQNMIMDLQDNQILQGKKIVQAQAQIAKIIPLMQKLVQQSSNEEVLGKAVVQLNDQCVSMASRIKSLEELLVRIADLEGKEDDSSKALQAKRIRILIKKSGVIFGSPVIQQESHWWQFGKNAQEAYI